MESKPKTFVEKTVNLILNILIVLFGVTLLISVYIGVQTKILKNKYADFFGYSIFEVKTGSMVPSINIGDWIIVNLGQDVALNDIVTYEASGEYITHRIIESYGGTYVTKGDANSAKDKPIDQSQIIGKVAKILPNFGLFRKTLFNPAVLITFIVTILLFDFAFKKKEDVVKVEEKTVEKSNKSKDFIVDLKAKLEDLIDNIKAKFDKKPQETEKLLVEQIEMPKEEETKKYYDFSDYTEEDNYQEEELEKTSLYRFVPVDMSEVDETFLEIAKNEMKEAEAKKKLEEAKEKEQEVELTTPEEIAEEEETLTKINLNLLKQKKLAKKARNIIDKAIIIKTEEINEILNILRNKSNDREINIIEEIFITSYIESKYYNYFGNDNTYTSKEMRVNIARFMDDIANELIKEYQKASGDKYTNKIKNYSDIFTLISSLEEGRDSIKDIKAKHQYYKKEVLKYCRYEKWDKEKVKYIADKIDNIQRNYHGIIVYILKKLQTNVFKLNFNELKNRKNIYGLELIHNIAFSKVYSDYIIDKTYSEGIIAEDKINVLITLLMSRLVENMMNGEFDNKYLLYIPETLYEKGKKFERVISAFDDEFAKNSVMIIVPYETALEYRTIIKKVMKLGYKFALAFKENDIALESSIELLETYEYIFASKKNLEKITTKISDDVKKKVIYENITSKVGDFAVEDGGEE